MANSEERIAEFYVEDCAELRLAATHSSAQVRREPLRSNWPTLAERPRRSSVSCVSDTAW